MTTNNITSALVANNATSTLSSGITNVATSLTVQSGDGAKYPSPGAYEYFYATLSNLSGTTVEIVKVTARATDTFTVVRAQAGTAAAAFAASDLFEMRMLAEHLREKADQTEIQARFVVQFYRP